jgi:ATP-dependent Clp protease ATP-binding subunit ClpB
MNLNNFTIKAQEAIQQAQQLATEKSHSAIETAHLLQGLLSTDEQTIAFLLKKVDANIPRLNQALEANLKSFAKVTGNNSLYLSAYANQVLIKAQTLMKEFGDEFVAVEHLLLALVQTNDATGNKIGRASCRERV